MPTLFAEWQHWEKAPKWNQAGFVETIDGGQAFRWQPVDDGYEGRWGRYVIRLRHLGTKTEFAIPIESEPAKVLPALNKYFAVDSNFEAITDALPWRNDPILRTAIEHFHGLRILRQPFAETLFCFLCSSTKQIPQIKAICETVASEIGETLDDGSHALPTWSAIANAGENCLRQAKLGYRARYIYQTACYLERNPGWLEETQAAPTAEARERLMQLPGVGRKIADCTLLFGSGRFDAFPIDTWVEKILSRAYQLEGWKLLQLQDLSLIHI